MGLCCIFIPNNTAPDGTITKALQGLTPLANELAENSGIDNRFTNLMEQWFGKWKGLMTSVLTSLVIVCGARTLIGPCVQGLVQQLIETVLTKQSLLPYPNSVLLLGTSEVHSKLLLTEFEEKNLK